MIFYDDEIKELSGQKYRPSNGFEGEIFMERFCYRCQKDKDQNCEIILGTMVFGVDEEEYPLEWQYGSDGQPICTSFDPAD